MPILTAEVTSVTSLVVYCYYFLLLLFTVWQIKDDGDDDEDVYYLHIAFSCTSSS